MSEHGASLRDRAGHEPSRDASRPFGDHPSREPFKLLDLFSGIGGFSLGLERTGGFKTVAFCEINRFGRRVLAKHWPKVPCYDDVRNITASRLAADGHDIDAISAGFPCQDISFAGLGAGLDGERSGLFFEIVRIAREIGERSGRLPFLILENVAALLSRGLGEVLRALAAIGYDAEWHCIPASAVGAWHYRDRIWILAYPACERPTEAGRDSERSTQRLGGSVSVLADAQGCETRCAQSGNGKGATGSQWPLILPSLGGCNSLVGASGWHSEPGICRVVNGISANVDRVAGLGNAVVPQIPELIGHAILAAECR